MDDAPPKGRYLLGERLLSVWIDIDKSPDPTTEPLSYRGMCQDAEKALGRAVDILANDPYLKHIDAEIEIGVIE